VSEAAKAPRHRQHDVRHRVCLSNQSGRPLTRPRFSKDVAPVIDLWPDMCCGPHTPETFRRKIALLAELGFQRVYFVVPPPGYAMFSSPWLDVLPGDNNSGHFGLESILNTPDPCFATTFEAHRHGMEAFAVLKPYEGGGGLTLPHGRKPDLPRHCIRRVGGEGVGFDNFIARHPEMLVERRPIADYERLVAAPIVKIEIAFCLDEVHQRTFDEKTIDYPSQSDDVLQTKPVRGVTLWTSEDNGCYARYEGELTVEERVERRVIRDAVGQSVYEEPRRCRVVSVTGFGLPDTVPYLALSLDASDGTFVTIPCSMIRLFGPEGEIPVTCTAHVRDQAKPVRGKVESKPFNKLGFEFDWHGSGFWAPGWEAAGCYGIARGRMRYMKGTLCEGHPEVRAYWLDQVARLVAMGVDGVDIRVQNHSGMVSDYAEFGYNTPIAEAYREKHGIDIRAEGGDPLEIMRIRGEFFTRFLEEALDLTRSHDRILQVHLRDCHENPELSSDAIKLGHWAMPKILLDWERVVDLADEITIKDYNYGHYNPQMSSRTKSLAHDRKKHLWVHCYLAQGGDLNPEFCRAVQDDERVTGMLLYETGHSENPNCRNVGLIGVSPDGRVFFHDPVCAALREIME